MNNLTRQMYYWNALNLIVHAFLQQQIFRVLRTKYNINHQYDYGGMNHSGLLPTQTVDYLYGNQYSSLEGGI